MAVVITVGGVAKSVKEGSLRISKTANGRATASFSIVSTDGSYRPDLDDEVMITENGTNIFGGIVERPREVGTAEGKSAGIITSISAVDFMTFAERRYSNGTLASQTLKSRLQSIITNGLVEYSITLDAGQVDGPTLPEYVSSWQTLEQLLNETMKLTADVGQPYVWRIDHDRKLKAYQPSTVSAPFDLTGDPIPEVLGEIEVEMSRQHFANRVYVTAASPLSNYALQITGDGSTSVFEVPYIVTSHPGVMLVGSGGGETAGNTASPGQWTISDMSAGLTTITRNIGATVNGETYTLTIDGSFTFVMSQDVTSVTAIGPYEKVVKVDVLPSVATAEAIADAELAKSLPVYQSVKYRTLETGLEPGMSQTITVTKRNVNLTAVISDVVISEIDEDSLVRDVTAIMDDAQTNLDRGWRDVYKKWAGDKSGGAIAVATTIPPGVTPGSSGPGAPDTSVQFNRNGVLGGDAAFTYNEATNSLVAGDSSSITAADPESCFVFGYDCHITD